MKTKSISDVISAGLNSMIRVVYKKYMVSNAVM